MTFKALAPASAEGPAEGPLPAEASWGVRHSEKTAG